MDVGQPTASEHLRILARAGLLKAKRIKQWTLYARDEKGIALAKKQFEKGWPGPRRRLGEPPGIDRVVAERLASAPADGLKSHRYSPNIPATMTLSPGQALVHYEVVELIGRGGMGEVYRARDTKLGRDVAIKVLPDEFMDSEERLARFKREAKVLASLNHPNIGGIYGLEESDSVRFLVLELVSGPTLAERLREGPLPVAEALELARQIAGALAAAHDRGVIHRDLKPANIKITPSGHVKVLDYGLAKALVDAPVDAKISDSPTLSAHATKMGVILGTAAYMSPEQARGKAVDKRTDIFSFGVVLYEMLTGRQLFKGEDAADTMASVIRSDPDYHALPADVPRRVREVLARCLEKDPEKRRRDIGDVRSELEAMPEPATGKARERPRPSPLWVAGALALSLATGIAGYGLRPDPPPRPVQQFEVSMPSSDAFRGLWGSVATVLAMSPRGTHLVFMANGQLYLRALDQVEAAPLRGTQSGLSPFFSPDGSAIGFWANGSLKKVALAGGSPAQLCESDFPFGVSWAGDGTIVYSRQSGVWEVAENGGALKELVGRTSEEYYYGPRKLPGRNVVLMTVSKDPANWDRGAIVVDSLDTGERKTLVQGGSDGRYVASGHLVYAVSSTLFAVPFDLETLEVSGEAVPVLEGVMRSSGQSGVAQFSVSDDGILAYLPEEALAGQGLFWVDRDGMVRRIGSRTASFETPRVSPDGNRLAVTLLEGQRTDVWVVDLARETFTQLTRDGASRYPDWSPDGEWIVYTSTDDLYRVRSDFRSPPERLLEREGAQIHARWLPDGTRIVFQEGVAEAADLWVLDLESDAGPRVFLQTPVNEAQPDLSPDGRFIAYHSSVSGGRSQIFVQPFDGPGARIQVSREEGVSPRWSPDGREIYFHGRENQAFMAASTRTDPVLEAGAPRLLFEWPIGMGFDRDYDVTPDGKRFVVVGPADPTATDATRPHVRIVLNWFSELERLVPTK